MNSTVNVALAGICGYGGSYLSALLDGPPDAGVRLVGVADPGASRSPRFEDLRERGVPIHAELPALYAGPDAVDLMLIVTPIHLHADQVCEALSRGSNVLCEKPLCATAADALRVVEAAERPGGTRFVAVGFQWSFSRAVQALKADIMSGALGRARRLRTVVMFPRGERYYRRNKWAGRVRTERGVPVFDSPLNNATAHYLHNMLYLLGPTRETAAWPAAVEAELYRANDIENYDTAALRVKTTCGAELLFYTTHATPERVGPVCRFEFEHAVVEFDHAAGGRFVARFTDGRTVDYGQPDVDRSQKIWQSVDAVRNGRPVACNARAALPHALCVAAARESGGEICDFPDAVRRIGSVGGEQMVWIDGLSSALTDCYEAGTLPSAAGHPWARKGRSVDVSAVLETSNFAAR